MAIHQSWNTLCSERYEAHEGKKWEPPYQSEAEKTVEIIRSKGRFSYLFFDFFQIGFFFPFLFSFSLNPYVVFGTIYKPYYIDKMSE